MKLAPLARLAASAVALTGLLTAIGLTANASTTSTLIQSGVTHQSCIYAGSPLQPGLTTSSTATGVTYNCASVYNQGATTWAQWDTPWFDSSTYGYTSWVAQAPTQHQLIIATDLIPQSLASSDPSGWESACAAGSYKTYATTLATNLVSAGLGSSVVRLGPEMNGPWEHDFMGTTTADQQLWASCFAVTASAMRAVPGANFLFDWNPNACYENVPFANFYPGSASVNVIGLDLYDATCVTPVAGLSTFSQLLTEHDGVNAFTAFAKSVAKPMSFPEWGLPTTAGDDATYVTGIANLFASGNFDFQAYFNSGTDGIQVMNSSVPLSLAAYKAAFATSVAPSSASSTNPGTPLTAAQIATAEQLGAPVNFASAGATYKSSDK